ncbi:unnamed protein product [Caenorhabditis angaria]|uniref:Uncharacterized protein n=1 Tax=Caenorhabditis angaria TaxID=860376 RepID=A0A9P1IJ97_9PELO|nr:unnamed protein product [Caenorhabditis angaria]
MSTIKILFEQIETGSSQILTDCDLQSVVIRCEQSTESSKKIKFRDAKTGTDVSISDKCIGPSCLKMNAGTSYEFQKLNATQIHRAINDPKLTEFLNRVYPLLKEELDDSNLFNKL